MPRLPYHPVCLLCLSVSLLACALTAPSKEPEKAKQPSVELKEAPLKAVLADVAKQKGKIVVIDIWGDFCLPCKKEFPHLVELHKKHHKDGVVCMSLAVDEVENKVAVHAFLKKQSATFPNYILSADSENWQDHWDITAVPAVVIYQDGKLTRKFTNDNPDAQFTYADVNRYIGQLLKERK